MPAVRRPYNPPEHDPDQADRPRRPVRSAPRALPRGARPGPARAHRKKSSGHGGRFVAEGEVVLDALLRRSLYAPESILVAQARLPSIAGLLAHVPEHVPVYAAGRAVMDAVVGFPIHRGVLGIGLRGAATRPWRSASAATARSWSASASPTTTMSAGSSATPPPSAPPMRPPRHRLGRSALPQGDPRLGRRRPDAAASPARRRMPSSTRWTRPASPRSPSRRAGRRSWPTWRPRPAWPSSCGAEGPGLPEDVLARTRGVRIAMARGAVARGFDSLNVATAAAIALHALMARAPGHRRNTSRNTCRNT